MIYGTYMTHRTYVDAAEPILTITDPRIRTAKRRHLAVPSVSLASKPQ